MTGRLRDAVAAELVKLRTLPAVLATAAGTVAAAILLAALLAAAARDGVAGASADAAGIVADAVPFLQAGTVLLGVLGAAAEHAGHQLRTTLTATPDRALALAGKAVAQLAAAAATGTAAVAAALGTAWAGGLPQDWAGLWPVAGAAGYLVLIALLAHALAVLLRSLVAPLVTMLGLVFVASPLLAGVTDRARWLPDRAGSALYLPGADAVPAPAAGAMVLLAWIAVAGLAAAAAFRARDA